MTVADARVKVTLPDHPKTKKLIRKCGQAGAWNLIRLFLFVAANRPDGDLAGMDDDDIEIAADWLGDPGALVAALVEVRFLTGEQGKRAVHDWADHNPWASGSEARSEKSRWAALCKQHGRQKAAEMMPEYAASLRVAPPESASGTPAAVPESASGTPLADSGSAPSPSPSPSPSPKQEQELTPPTPRKRGEGVGTSAVKLKAVPAEDRFAEFWQAYPRKVAKPAAEKAWRKVAAEADAIMAGLRRQAGCEQWAKDGGQFIPYPATWLNGRRWEDAPAAAVGVASSYFKSADDEAAFDRQMREIMAVAL